MTLFVSLNQCVFLAKTHKLIASILQCQNVSGRLTRIVIGYLIESGDRCLEHLQNYHHLRCIQIIKDRLLATLVRSFIRSFVRTSVHVSIHPSINPSVNRCFPRLLHSFIPNILPSFLLSYFTFRSLTPIYL